MESWRLAWRNGFAKVLPTAGLEALAKALRDDDPRLTQGSTTTPPPLMMVQDWPVEAACALGFCGTVELGGFADEQPTGRQTNPGAATVGAVEEFFAKACFQADQELGEPAACRWFLQWFDDTPRDEMRRELLAEVELTLVTRGVVSRTTVEQLADAVLAGRVPAVPVELVGPGGGDEVRNSGGDAGQGRAAAGEC